jgi:hypothetical protein
MTSWVTWLSGAVEQPGAVFVEMESIYGMPGLMPGIDVLAFNKVRRE